MADIPDPTPPTPTPPVNPSPLAMIVKGQVRIWVAFVAGALLAKHIVPASLAPFVNDQAVDIITGTILAGGMAGWQAFRSWITHSRFWTLATNPRVPDDLVRPASK